MRIVTILFRMMNYLPRLVDKSLAEACSWSPIVVLDGPRGAGKTTTAQRLAKSVISLPDDLERLEVNPQSLASLPGPVLIDEWQLAGVELLWTLKRIVDNDPAPGRFILVGSVEPASYGPTYPLTGRAVRLVMRPMTAAELDGRGSEDPLLAQIVDGVTPTATAGQPNRFDLQHIFTPGFPITKTMQQPEFFLDAYAAITAQRAGDEGRDASRLMTTMRVLATLEGQAVPDQRVWESADINKLTWKTYQDLLARVHITASLPAFSSNRLARLTTYPKRFLADTSLALALAGIDQPQLEADPTLAGRYVESFFMQQLRPQVDQTRGLLHHLRTSASQHEIDAIVDTGSKIYAFEVKHSATPSGIEHLVWLRDQTGDRFGGGYVIYEGGDTYLLEDNIWALPLTAFT